LEKHEKKLQSVSVLTEDNSELAPARRNCIRLWPVTGSITFSFTMRLKTSLPEFRVTLICVSMAVGCILVSNELVNWVVSTPDQRTGIFIFKGWTLMLAAGGWLSLAMRGWVQSWKQETGQLERGDRTRPQGGEKLLESEACYRQLLELESAAVFLLDGETHRFVDVNQSAQRLYGYTREEFLQMTWDGVFDGPERTRAKVVSGSQFAPLRWHRKKNGGRFSVEINSRVFSCQGRCLKLAIIRDTTARQHVLDMLEQTTGQPSETQPIAGLSSYAFDLKPNPCSRN
jgi:PAS domain S-box-containing protein